ncbi:hypothetical protein EDC04DRAFT_2961848 [Pisolithus marmoratus]|nr:hypothetical protein EDC04DRAFT_2961848 [Pisolithus marmoratus]
MPSVAEKSMALAELSSYFPLTLPVPTPNTHSDLLTINDVQREEDLLRNPASFRAWWTAIHNTREVFNAQLKAERRANTANDARAQLLGPLATPLARRSLQCLTYLYESALVQLPGSFKLWKSYLQMRMSYVLGTPIHKKRAGGRKKFADMKDALEEERDYSEEWDGGLDGVVGWEEWKSLVATYERALMWLPKLPRLWLMYFSIFSHPFCPPVISHTHARHTFDRALRTLPPSLHARIWMRYLLWAEGTGGATMVAVYHSAPRPLEAAKLLLSLARKATRGEYVSPRLGKVPTSCSGISWTLSNALQKKLGLTSNDTVESNAADTRADAEAKEREKEEPASADGKLTEDPLSKRKLNIERIVRKDGLEVYKDQAGRLWTGLATYWIKRGEFDRAKTTFEAGIASVLTIRDFTQIFHGYSEFCESIISAMMEGLENPDEEEDEEDIKETEHEEWEKRVALWGDDDEKVAETYSQALQTINPRKATANLFQLYINFARYYEEGGASGTAEPDLDSARKILEKATKVNFKTVEDLAEIWCEWAEMELRHDPAGTMMKRSESCSVLAAIPKDTKINYHDHSLPVQARLFKSLKLWSFYVDLEESIGTVESAKAAYDKIMELKIANAQIIVNYAAFLEENQYWEDSFRVYERGTEVFTYPISFEIWNIYLSKFIKRYGGTKLERARDLFEQALEKCPSKSCKPLFLMYGQLEEDYGLAKRAMAIYERATQVVADEDKFEMYAIYIAKATANYGLPATRPIYERAIEILPPKQTAEMCLRFAALERKLGEIDRARAIYAHASQFWSEDTFREMLRIKRSVQAQFNTEASYLAAQTLST